MSPPLGESPAPERPVRSSVSQRVADRLRDAGVRFHANDNIVAYLRPGELEELEQEVAGKASALLENLEAAARIVEM